GFEAGGERLPMVHLQHRAEMRDWDVVAVDRIAVRARLRARGIMGDDLVAVEIEIDPLLGAAALRAAEQGAVEGARGADIVDGEGEVEGRKLGHGNALSPCSPPCKGGAGGGFRRRRVSAEAARSRFA